MMFIAAYWGRRPEPKGRVADRLADFLQAVASSGDALATWYLKGRSRELAKTPVAPTALQLAAFLKTNRRDDNGEVMSELGFSLGLWNGGHVSLQATIGAFSPHVQNSVVLSYDRKSFDLDRSICRAALEAAVQAFDPDKAVVTSTEYLETVGVTEPSEAGMLTYRRGGKVEEHSFT